MSNFHLIIVNIHADCRLWIRMLWFDIFDCAHVVIIIIILKYMPIIGLISDYILSIFFTLVKFNFSNLEYWKENFFSMQKLGFSAFSFFYEKRQHFCFALSEHNQCDKYPRGYYLNLNSNTNIVVTWNRRRKHTISQKKLIIVVCCL